MACYPSPESGGRKGPITVPLDAVADRSGNRAELEPSKAFAQSQVMAMTFQPSAVRVSSMWFTPDLMIGSPCGVAAAA